MVNAQLCINAEMALRDKKDILIKYDNFKSMFFTGEEAESYKRVRESSCLYNFTCTS